MPLQLKAAHIHARTLAKMGEAIKGADQVRLLGRSYSQGYGSEAEMLAQQGKPMQGLISPTISVDTSVLDSLLKKLEPTDAVSSDNDDAGAW